MKRTFIYSTLICAMLSLGSCGGSETKPAPDTKESPQTEELASEEEMETLQESEELHTKTSEANAKLDSIMNQL